MGSPVHWTTPLRFVHSRQLNACSAGASVKFVCFATAVVVAVAVAVLSTAASVVVTLDVVPISTAVIVVVLVAAVIIQQKSQK